MDDKDCEFMKIAIEEAKLDPRPHKVGAVVAHGGEEAGRAHGGEPPKHDHAEATLLARVPGDLRGATIYTTLEPCTKRGHPDKCCALLIKERGIGRVVIGVSDPNPNITNTALFLFKKEGIDVEFADEFRGEIQTLMGEWFLAQNARRSYSKVFADVNVSPEIAAYTGPSVGTSQTLRLCPEVKRGWLMAETRLHHEKTKFHLPDDLGEDYRQYFARHYNEKGFDRDSARLMLVQVPLALSDTSRRLSLHTKESSFSYAKFCADVIASDQVQRAAFIDEINTTGQIRFPHSLCLQIVVVTEDNKILLTKRSPYLQWFPDSWSCSIEEQTSEHDLSAGIDHAVLAWGKRTLFEELGLSDSAYSEENLRLISVFLESDILNVSLCGHVVLNISWDQLNRILQRKPRMDKEFTAWEHLPYTEDALLSEILHPRPGYQYHPTSGYRMLMTLLKRNGLPDDEQFFAA